MGKLNRFYPKLLAKRELSKLLDKIQTDKDSTINVVDMPVDDIGGQQQVTFPSEFPARPIPSEPEGAAETLYHRPRQATNDIFEQYHIDDDPGLRATLQAIWNRLGSSSTSTSCVGGHPITKEDQLALERGEKLEKSRLTPSHIGIVWPDGEIDEELYNIMSSHKYFNRAYDTPGRTTFYYHAWMKNSWKELVDQINDIEQKTAEIGQELAELTTEREPIKTRQKLTQHGLWSDSYRDDNKFEDADNKLGASDEPDSLNEPVYEPYAQGTGPLKSRYEDTNKNTRNVILHATRRAQEENKAEENTTEENKSDRKGDSHQLWICVDLDDTILSSPEEYQDQNGDHVFGEILPGKRRGFGPREALQELIDGGARVSIFTARQYFDKDESRLIEQVTAALNERGVPFTDVYVGKKPPAHFFIDDKTIPPFDGDWDLVLDAVRDKLNKTANVYEWNGSKFAQVNKQAVRAIYKLDEDSLIRLYELEYKLSQLKKQDYLDDRLYMKALQWENELSRLLNNAITAMSEIYEQYITNAPQYHTEEELSKEPHITIGNIYNKLQQGTSGDINQDMILFHQALTTVHHNGEMLDFLSGETGISGALLNNLTSGEYVDEWDEELSRRANDPVKDQVDYKGILIDIEWPKGSIRSYEGDDTYVTHMKASYGYSRGIEGSDGEELDIYLGDGDSDIAYVVEQIKDDGSYDEDKIMLGFDSEQDAAEMFLEHMPGYMLGSIRAVPIDRFVNALYGKPEDRRGEEDQVPSEEIQKSAGLQYMAGKTPGEKVGLFIPLPPELAKQYPPEGKAGEDDSDPHLTVLYIGNVSEERWDELKQIVEEELKDVRPFELELLPSDIFINHHDQTIVHSPVEGAIGEGVADIHHDVKQKLLDAGFELKNPDREFKPHVTIEYVDPDEEPKFSDVEPTGSWLVDEIEIWGLGEPYKIPLQDIVIDKAAKKDPLDPWKKKKKTVKTKSDYVGPQTSQVGDIGGVGADNEDEEEKKAFIRKIAQSYADIAYRAIQEANINELAKVISKYVSLDLNFPDMVDELSRQMIMNKNVKNEIEALIQPTEKRPHLPEYPSYTEKEVEQALGPTGTQPIPWRGATKTWPGEEDAGEEEWTDPTETRENLDIPREQENEKLKYRNAESSLKKFLKNHDIKQEKGCIGFSDKEQKWYGWSHRAIHGFGIGDEVKEGSVIVKLPVGFKAKTLDDAKKMAIDFANSIS